MSEWVKRKEMKSYSVRIIEKRIYFKWLFAATSIYFKVASEKSVFELGSLESVPSEGVMSE
jgi:hypothetical protein